MAEVSVVYLPSGAGGRKVGVDDYLASGHNVDDLLALADGLKAALALLWERRNEYPGAVPILAVHDEIVVECDEDQAEKAAGWLEKAMIDGMNGVLSPPRARRSLCAGRGRGQDREDLG